MGSVGFEGCQVKSSLFGPSQGRQDVHAGSRRKAVKARFLSLAAPNSQLHLAGILSKTWRTTDHARWQFAPSRDASWGCFVGEIGRGSSFRMMLARLSKMLGHDPFDVEF